MTHKFVTPDPGVGQRIREAGGRLVADYGSYQLYEAEQSVPGTERHDEYDLVLLNAGTIDSHKPEAKVFQTPIGDFPGKRMRLIHFAGPILPEWHESLLAAGVQIISYVPHNAFLVYGDAQSLSRVHKLAQSQTHIQWEGEYLSVHKVHPKVRSGPDKTNPDLAGDEYAIQLVADPEANAATLSVIETRKLRPILQQQTALHYLNVIVPLSLAGVAEIAAQPDVVSIQPFCEPTLACERQAQIVAGNLTNQTAPLGPGYLAWLAGKGFSQQQFTESAFVIDLADTGIDNGTLLPSHSGLWMQSSMGSQSRLIYNRLLGVPNANSTLKGCDGHGTLNAHILAGFDNTAAGFPRTDASGYHYGLGICPFVRIGASVIFDPAFTYPNFFTLASQAYEAGARIGNHSWGHATSLGAYTIESQTFDILVRDAQSAVMGNQEMTFVFPVGNEGPSARTVRAPASAKNVIAVGASENVQLLGDSDGSGVTDLEANNARDLAVFSSRGPCADGRHKPDLVAPGTHVSGGVVQQSSPGLLGAADPCFTGSLISGGPGGHGNFFPAGQQFYTVSSGTSHAVPAISGCCALLRQYFLNHYTNPPSPAMTKAFLMNSARYLTGASAADSLWSDNQGMGSIDLGRALDGMPRMLRDQVPVEIFTASGQTRIFQGTVSDSGKPFRVTLAWTDAPGNTTGAAFNNNLELTVSIGGQSYKGNVFSGPYSVTNGTADIRNNVESVFLPAGATGDFVVTITAANINSDAIPNNGQTLDQDFALVVYNAVPIGLPNVVAAGASFVAENFFPKNGVPDSDEIVTFALTLKNVGTGATSNLVATLLPHTTVVDPSGPQSYGALNPEASASRPFTFKAVGNCGDTVSINLQLQDGTRDLGTATYVARIGTFVPGLTLTESFDSVLAPALPPGWGTNATGVASPWRTTTLASDTAPNCVFASAAAGQGTAELISPSIPILSSSAQLSFRHHYQVECDPSSPLVAYDGGVLELSVDGGPFRDILAAGGLFVTNGYVRTVSPATISVFAGRPVWSGDSSNFVSTIVNLPAAVAGHSIRAKWWFATDDGALYGSTGWRIDNIAVTDGSYSCVLLVTPQINKISRAGDYLVIRCSSVPGLTYSLAYKDSLNDRLWKYLPPSSPGTGTNLTFIAGVGPATRFYRVMATK